MFVEGLKRMIAVRVEVQVRMTRYRPVRIFTDQQNVRYVAIDPGKRFRLTLRHLDQSKGRLEIRVLVGRQPVMGLIHDTCSEQVFDLRERGFVLDPGDDLCVKGYFKTTRMIRRFNSESADDTLITGKNGIIEVVAFEESTDPQYNLARTRKGKVDMVHFSRMCSNASDVVVIHYRSSRWIARQGFNMRCKFKSLSTVLNF